MGLFDFFKKKNANTDLTEEVVSVNNEQDVEENDSVNNEQDVEENDSVINEQDVEENDNVDKKSEAIEDNTVKTIDDQINNVEQVADISEESEEFETAEEVVPEENAVVVEEETVIQLEDETAVEISEENITESLDETTDNVTEDIENIETKSDENISTEPVSEKKSLFSRIKAGLEKTRNNILSGVDNVLKAFVKIDEDLFEELEEALIMADIGVDTSLYIIEKLGEKVKDEKATESSQVKELLIKIISEILEKDEEPLNLKSPSVILVIGVNGVGKTTTIGKLAHNYKSEGKSVLLAAADTFRAAAIDQLQIWGDRNNCEVIKHQENSDPAAVVFDAVNAAKARKTDVLICDTAGRLHNKKNLMEELRKIAKIIDREYPEAHTEVFLVLDSTTGQNAIQQAKLFSEVANITGLVLTKLDGTAKGGIVLAIKHDMNIPVRYIGVGEQINDLQPFNSKDFAKALFDEQ